MSAVRVRAAAIVAALSLAAIVPAATDRQLRAWAYARERG